MPKKLTYVKKCQYETLKQKIIECLICFSNLKIIQTSLQFLHEVSGEASPTFGHANANFSVFIDRIRN